MEPRKLVAEGLGTALLVFFGVGAATLSFGFKLAGPSASAGVVATALAFGLVMLILAYAIGPISGAHINPAVTMGFLVSGRMPVGEAIGYWIAQVVGGIAGAGALRLMFAGAEGYSTTTTGLGTDGFGAQSMINLGLGGAFLAETILTFLFVLVVLCVTTKSASTALSGLAIGFALATVHLVGIPLTGTSVNPARSIGPALFVGGSALVNCGRLLWPRWWVAHSRRWSAPIFTPESSPSRKPVNLAENLVSGNRATARIISHALAVTTRPFRFPERRALEDR